MPETERLYGIAIAATRAGLSLQLIRMWEKRHGCIRAKRTQTNRRVYDQEDINRLILLKKLTTLGHGIGAIAGLGTPELRKLLMEAESLIPPLSPPGSDAVRRILAFGVQAQIELGENGPFECTLVGAYGDRLEAGAEESLPVADLLVAELPAITPADLEALASIASRCQARRTILIYPESDRDQALALAGAREGVSLLQAPVKPKRLRRECVLHLNRLFPLPVPLPPGGNRPVPPRLYAPEQVAQVTKFANRLACECPRHIAKVLTLLCEFEEYCEDCVDREPEDAQLHDFLHRTTAHARRLMEEAMRHVVRAEGIQL
jgi:hypothetical protein